MGNHFPYKTICYWLGGGLQQINKSFVHNGKTITANRMMKGFVENKIAVIGRNMEGRVKPFVDKLSNELGIPVLMWQGFDDNVTDKINVLNNRAWIKALKEEGYTFYDIGLDPFYTSQGIFDEGLFYSMELDEVFR